MSLFSGIKISQIILGNSQSARSRDGLQVRVQEQHLTQAKDWWMSRLGLMPLTASPCQDHEFIPAAEPRSLLSQEWSISPCNPSTGPQDQVLPYPLFCALLTLVFFLLKQLSNNKRETIIITMYSFILKVVPHCET